MPAVRPIQVPQAQLAPEERGRTDLAVLVPTLLLVALGIAMVFSAGIPMAAADESENIYFYLKRELLFAALGLAMMWAVMRAPLDAVRDGAAVLLAAAVGLLILVLFVGVEVNGARSWLPIPFTPFRFQPSEMAKIVLVIAAARYFAKFPAGVPTWRRALPPFVTLGVVAALVAVEPDLGTAAVLVAAMLIYFHIAGAKLRHLMGAGFLGLSFAAAMAYCHPYQLARMKAFLFRTELASSGGYHTTQSLIAMGSGGIFGRGYCGSVEKYFYLPAAIHDSILAVIGEELGFAATAAILVLFGILTWRGMAIAARAPDRFSGLLAVGVTCMLAVQALVHVAVATDCAPATGMPLPFVSYGGSSLVFSLIGVGLLLNVARNQRGRPIGRETP